MNAIILAGAPNKGSLRQMSPVQYEAEIEIAGRPMLDYVILALEGISSLKRIVIVGSESMLSQKLKHKDPRFLFAEPGESVVDSLRNGLDILKTNDPVLILTSDIPLITREALEDFLSRCKTQPGDVYYSFVPKSVNDQKYPGVQRTYVRLKEGTFTGGNLILLAPQAINSKIDILTKAATLRKKPLQLCQMLGWRYLVKLLLGVLTIKEIEERASRMLGVKAVGIISPYPEVGIDVDKPSDLIFARKVLAR